MITTMKRSTEAIVKIKRSAKEITKIKRFMKDTVKVSVKDSTNNSPKPRGGGYIY